jgi:hypothetical protein
MKRLTLTLLFLLGGLAACSPQNAVAPGSEPQLDVPQASVPETNRPGSLRVAYPKNADPWIWMDGEGARQLADSVNVEEVVISSDGQVVAFKRGDTMELMAVNADGGNLHTIVSANFLADENAWVWAFDFAPQSHQVFFTLKLTGNDFQPFYDLHQVNTDATEPTPSLVFAPGQGGIATFSPDGQWMTLYHPGGLDLARVDGSESRTVISYPEGYEPATFGPTIVWMQDSSGFALFHAPDPQENLSRGGLWFVPVNGEPVERTAIANTWGIPSPDGQRVGFISTDGLDEVRIVEADGTISVYMTAPGANFIGWAPDSQYFILTLEEELNDQPIYVPYLCRLGEEPVLLSDTHTADPVVWITGDGFLFASWGKLRLKRIGMPSLLLDDQIYNVFDYAWFTP